MFKLSVSSLLFFAFFLFFTQSSVAQKEARTPMMGWASWNNYRIEISESIIKAQADALVANGLDKYGYNFINIDDGFWGGRDANGNIFSHPEKFPNGMKNLASYIHSKGLKAGIYTDAGLNTCASYWDKDTIGVGMGLFGNEKRDLLLMLNDWDYDFIKVDWCGGDWMGLDEQTRYTEIGSLIKTIKPSASYNVCRWQFPGNWVTSIADSWRISQDIANEFDSILKIIDKTADLWRFSTYGHYNDMDILQVGRGLTYEEDKTHFTMWCMLNSPLILGNDLMNMTEETKRIITNQEVIALNQSEFVYQARRLVDYGELEVWAKPLVSAASGQVAVALLNRTNEPQTIRFDLETVGIAPAKGYIVKDLWEKTTYGTQYQKTLSMQVPPHGVVALKVTGESIPFNVFQYKQKD